MISQKFTTIVIVSVMLGVVYTLLSKFGVAAGAPLVVALPLILFLVVSPGRALIFAWFCLSFLPFIVREYLGNSAYQVINEGVVALLWMSWIARIMIEGRIRGIPNPLKLAAILILTISFVSLMVNKTNPVYWAEWVLTYLLPIPVLAISRTYLKSYTPKRLVRIIVIFMLIQFVLNITWHAGINPLRNHSAQLDLSCGTYGNTAATAYITLALIFAGMAFWVSSRQYAGAKLRTLIFILLACIQFIFTFTVHAYLLIPIGLLVFVFFYPRAKGKGPGKIIYVLSLLSLITLILVPIMSNFSLNKQYRQLGGSSVEYGQKAWRSVWHGPKVDVIRRVIKVARPIQLAVGMGPNSAVSYTGMLLNNPQTIRLIGEWYYTASGRKELSTGSIRESLFSGVVMLLSEIGITGLIIYMIFLTYPLFHIVRHVKFDNTISAERRFLIVFVVILLLTNIAIGIVWDVWRIRMLSIGIWLLLGRIWDPEDEENMENNQSVSNENALSEVTQQKDGL